jgi:hypothetical protein
MRLSALALTAVTAFLLGVVAATLLSSVRAEAAAAFDRPLAERMVRALEAQVRATESVAHATESVSRACQKR